MTSLVVFGAGGRAGRRITAQGRDRGLNVTAVVRDPARHPDLNGAVAGDVTDAAAVATVAAGHDVAVSAVYDAVTDPADLYGDGTRALLEGLAAAGVPRLLVIGIATTLESPDGTKVFESADFPVEYRPFSVARAAELSALQQFSGPVDWVVLTPPMQLTDEPATGRYTLSATRRLLDGTLTYADLASAVLDEATSPAHHRAQIAVTG